MTLIIEIALGIVLGCVLLANLDALLGLGMVFVTIVVGLAILGGAWYLLINHWAEATVIGCLIGAIVAPLVLIERINPARGRYLKKRIKDRESLGYEATQERTELEELIKKRTIPRKLRPITTKLPSGGTLQKEQERRRLLGYDE